MPMANRTRKWGGGSVQCNLTLRLHYDIQREFAPYLSVMWTDKYDGKAGLARAVAYRNSLSG